MSEAQQVIMDRSMPEPNSGCWLWLGGLYSDGYGLLWKGGRQGAHRASYRAFKGEIPAGHLVRHTCDVPSCVNPDHLLLGTDQDNSNDKVQRGRAAGQPKGRSHWKASLTDEQVLAIRADPRPQRVIAAEYGVLQQAVSKIKRGQTWGHLSAEKRV